MNIARAVGIGVVCFLATLVINGAIARILGIDLGRAHPTELPASMWIAAIVSAALLSIPGAYWYFLPREIVANTRNGAMLGVVAVATGIVLDFAAILPRKGGLHLMLGYLKSVPYWVALVLVFLGCTLVGAWHGWRGARAF